MQKIKKKKRRGSIPSYEEVNQLRNMHAYREAEFNIKLRYYRPIDSFFFVYSRCSNDRFICENK